MITGFLQGFVDNEINFNKEHTCKNTCEDYRITRQYGCNNDTPCGVPLKNQRINKCKGILRDCEFIGSDLEICPSISSFQPFSNNPHNKFSLGNFNDTADKLRESFTYNVTAIQKFWIRTT